MQVTCTLLGPEGPGLAAFSQEGGVGTDLWALSSSSLSGRRAGYRPYFENYTVDASIFDSRDEQAFGSA